MAFDGFFYFKHSRALNKTYAGLKLDKIYQNNKQDIYLSFNKAEYKHILISINSASPRIEALKSKPEMPVQAPMFCMLLRKHLSSAQLEKIEQIGMERIIQFKFRTNNQIGEMVFLTLIVEIMGKHSNLMLVKEDGTIIDSLKRIGATLSPRVIAPNYAYQMPPTSKINLLEENGKSIYEALINSELPLQKAFYSIFAGISPSITKVIIHRGQLNQDDLFKNLSEAKQQQIILELLHLLEHLNDNYFYIYKDQFRIREISALPLVNSENLKMLQTEDYQEHLNQYYLESKTSNTIQQKAKSTSSFIDFTVAKLKKKIKNLEGDIKKAQHLEEYRLYGELLTANLHQMHKGDKAVSVMNYYDNNMLTIPLDTKQSPNQNAQNYFKKYNKAKVTLQKAKKLIAKYNLDIAYLLQVKAMLLQSDNTADIDELIAELVENNYIKAKSSKRKKKQKKLPPHHYRSSDNIDIYVGRNNLQNDELSLKKAQKEHIWLHTKDIAGAHVIIAANFEQVSDQTLIEAAEIAAYHSDGRMSSQVPVDLTEVKYVKKPKGAKPGMVIYTDNKTIYANPEKDKINARKVDE